MPFTIGEFFAVFAQYNEAIWPLPVVAHGAAIIVIALMFVPGRASAALVTLMLAAMWAVNGIGYHWMFFSDINPMARVFAALFVVEAVALAVSTYAFRDLRFAVRRDARSLIGLLLVAFALVVYPAWGWLAGHAYPAMPMFGVAPCPTTIFTVGVLLLGTWNAVRALLVIPIFWSAVGGTAALLLGVPQDYGLVATLVIAVLIGVGHWRGKKFALHAPGGAGS